MNAKLDIRVELRDSIPVVRIKGEVDLYSSPSARKIVLSEARKTPPHLVVDLSGVTYMDSSGIATLVEGLQAMEKRGGQLVLCGLHSMVRELFELTHLDTVFTIAADVDEALALCNRPTAT